jgi:Ca2+-binding RTX toxin-like protein
MRDRFSPLLWGTAAIVAAGCGVDADATGVAGQTRGQDPFAPILQDLTQLATPCTYNSSTRQLTVTLAANEVALVRRFPGPNAPADDFVMVNGFDCNGVAVPAGTSNTPVDRVAVTGSAGNESVIFDFTAGLFALGTNGTNGITVDLGAGTGDMLGIRLGTLDDSVVYGASGIQIVNASAPADAFRDITATNVEIHKMSLGAGNDTVTAGGNTQTGGGVFIPTGSLELYGGDGDDTFVEGPIKTPRERISGGNGNDIVDYSQRAAALTISVSSINVPSSNDGDLSTTTTSPAENDDIKDDVESIIGASGNDNISGGGPQGIFIFGGAGNDTIAGGPGNDTLVGGSGNDWFYEGTGTTGSDVFIGSDGIDTIDYSGRTAGVTITLDGTADDGQGGTEADNVGTDIENIIGGQGNDFIVGSSKNNNIIGGPGADTMQGGGGLDTVSYAPYGVAVVASLPVTIDPTDFSIGNGTGAGAEGDWIFGDIENLTGGQGADLLTGNSGPNELSGGLGDDTLVGGAGIDVLEGGAAGNTESNVLDCGDDDDIGEKQGSGIGAMKIDCEF